MPEASTPFPSATILMLRDGPTGLETFMVVRHHQIDFASGALVFPGGKVDAGGGFANSALLVCDCDNSCHLSALATISLGLQWG